MGARRRTNQEIAWAAGRVRQVRDAHIGEILQAARDKPPIPTFGAMQPPSTPGSGAGVVRLLNPDGSLREVLSAQEFRKRHPLKYGHLGTPPVIGPQERKPFGPRSKLGKWGRPI